MSGARCLCGEIATHTAYLPMPNIYAGIRPVTEPHAVCDYHAAKARSMGYLVEEGTGRVGYVEEREEIKLGEGMIEVPLGRFPTVYGDWVNLAEDIKDRRPDLALEVNTSLESVMRHDSEMGKQQLEKIAKEIGIMKA